MWTRIRPTTLMKKYVTDGYTSYLGWDSRDDEFWDCSDVTVGFDGRE